VSYDVGMRTSISMGLAAALALAAGCGGGGGEEVTGTLAIDWGDEHVVAETGAAIENPDEPGQMVVAMGNLDMDCGWYDDRIKNGTAVTFLLDPPEQATGAYTPLISVLHVEGDSLSINGSTGTLNISAFGDRIVGDLDMDTTDDDNGVITVITATGTFDVINCF
jgi:hypothetical protein